VHGVDESVRAAGDVPEIMIIGGAELFRKFLPVAGRVHLTRVHADIDGDVRWPELDRQQWRVVDSQPHDPDERHAWALTFEVWEKF
jgi:dihydrofolate reductase